MVAHTEPNDLEKSPGYKSSDSGSVSDGSIVPDIGAQIAQESGNEIQYRTCSWQKVRTHLSTLYRGWLKQTNARERSDGCPAVL